MNDLPCEPLDDEDQDEFLTRCMAELDDDYPDPTSRAIVCQGCWDGSTQNTVDTIPGQLNPNVMGAGQGDPSTMGGGSMGSGGQSSRRSAIGVHHTATEDGSWDGPAAEAHLKTDGTEAYYRSAFAWVDSEGDPTKKSSYKFPHHEVSADGKIGAANIKACQAIIGSLNGGRGGAKIPSGDREGVYRHAAAHLKDAGQEPAPLRSHPGMAEVERRALPVELRLEGGEAQPTKIVGYAAVYNKLSQDLGGFREQIAPGAFARNLDGADVRALFNHDPNFVLGRTTAKTLRLSDDDQGLRIEIDPPETSYASDLLESMRRGDISQMSFGFRTLSDDWSLKDGENVRTLRDVELLDVSPVTFPAYPQTSVAMRSLKAFQGQQEHPDHDTAALRQRLDLEEAS